MPQYRIYFTDRDAHISGPPHVVESANDEQATAIARQFIDGKDIELWKGASLIAKFPHTPDE